MRKNEYHTWEYCEHGGFFNANPHIYMETLYQYDDEDKTELNQNIIITDKDVFCYNIWNYYFNKEALTTDIQNAGFNKF